MMLQKTVNFLTSHIHIVLLLKILQSVSSDSTSIAAANADELTNTESRNTDLSLADSSASITTHLRNPNRELNAIPDKTYLNLRLHWQRGYRWQESSKEKFWCLACKRECNLNDGVDIQWCNRSDAKQQFYFDNGKIRSGRNKRMCLTRMGRSIKLRSCSSTQHQKWSGLSSSGRGPFALQIPGNSDKCGKLQKLNVFHSFLSTDSLIFALHHMTVSQHHHPKAGEDVYMESCKLARMANTDKWVAY